MKPYYEDKYCTIYHGDCREVLPTLAKVDLVLTDPPYGIGEAKGKNKSRGCGAKARDYGVANWDDSPAPRWIFDALAEKTPQLIVFGGNYYAFPPSPCWLVWDKDNGETDFADCELAWTNLNCAVRRKRYRWNGMLQERMGHNKEDRFHPTQKPTEVMEWCITIAGDSAQTILDPFMGSGTTLVAAKNLGRKAIGIEIEEKYCEIAVKRLSQEVFDFERKGIGAGAYERNK